MATQLSDGIFTLRIFSILPRSTVQPLRIEALVSLIAITNDFDLKTEFCTVAGRPLHLYVEEDGRTRDAVYS
jgi:hypothetical protein